MRILVLFQGILQLHFSLRKTCLLDPMELRVWDSAKFCKSLSFHLFMHRPPGKGLIQTSTAFSVLWLCALAKVPFVGIHLWGDFSAPLTKKYSNPKHKQTKNPFPYSPQKRTYRKSSEIPARVKKGIFLRDSSTLTFLCSWWNLGGILNWIPKIASRHQGTLWVVIEQA